MSDFEAIIRASGKPSDQHTLDYYLWQIKIQKEKQKDELRTYKNKTDTILQKKTNELNVLLKRYKDATHQGLEESDFANNKMPMTWEQFLEGTSQSSSALSLDVRIKACNADLANRQEEYEKEFKRREEAYNVKIQRFMIRIEGLAKKVKSG